jgi:ribosomal-protein-alanine N-acetyltransferase
MDSRLRGNDVLLKETMHETLHGETIALIPYQPQHRKAVEAMLCDTALTDWLPFRTPYAPEELDQMLAQIETSPEGFRFWVIEQNQQIIGSVGMQSTGYRHLAQLFYWVSRGAQGRGVATDMLRTLKRAILKDWGYTRVQALVEPNNIPSIRALEKSGFAREGLLRKYFIKSFTDMNALIDVYMYASVRE